MIKVLRFLSFELAPSCNLANQHPWCPINDLLRYPDHETRVPSTNEQIISFAKACIGRGFQGEIAYHYYSEPCLSIDRIEFIMDALPEAKHILWTNGHLLYKVSDERLDKFNSIAISVYEEKDMEYFQGLCLQHPNMTASPAPHDRRIEIYDQKTLSSGGCSRPYETELIVNYYGHLRMCCGDYRGTVPCGHIADDHEALLDKWEEMSVKCLAGVYPLCWQCRAIHSPAIHSPAIRS